MIITVTIDKKDQDPQTVLRKLKEARIPITGALGFGAKKVTRGRLKSSRCFDTGSFTYKWTGDLQCG